MINKISKIFKRSKIDIDKPWQWPSLSGILNSNSGKDVNEWKSLQLSSVYACIRLISSSIAMLPLTLHQSIDEMANIATWKKLNNVLYRQANEYMTAYLFKQTIISHMLLWGNGYALKQINGAGEIIALYPLSPWSMEPLIDEKGKYYLYKTDKKTIRYESKDIFHLPNLSFDGLKGYSPIQVMRNELNLSSSLQKFGYKYFENGTNLGGVLEHPGRLGNNARIHLKEDVHENFTGIDNTLKLMILEEGMKYTKFSIPADDAQFIQSRKFQLEEICRYFGVQLHMIQNLDRSSFNNIEQQSTEFKTYCLGPIATTFEQEIWKSLLTEAEKQENYYAKFNFNALMRADYKSRMEGYRTAVQMGLYSLNEIRKKEDENPIKSEGGETHWVNSAMVPIDNQNSGGGEQDVKGSKI